MAEYNLELYNKEYFDFKILNIKLGMVGIGDKTNHEGRNLILEQILKGSVLKLIF